MASKIKMEVPYFQTPNNIFDRKGLGLDGLERLVFIYLCRCGNHGAKAFPSYKKIAESTGMSRDKAIKSIDKLIQKEYIKKKTRSKSGERQSNIYIISNLVVDNNHLVAENDIYKEQDIKNNNIPQKGLHRDGNRYYNNGKRIKPQEYKDEAAGNFCRLLSNTNIKLDNGELKQFDMSFEDKRKID